MKNYLQAEFWLHQLYNKPRQHCIAITLIVLLGFFWLLSLIYSHQQIQYKSLHQATQTIAQITGQQLSVPMNANNLVGMQSLLNNLTQNDLVISAEVLGLDNQVLVQAGADTLNNQTVNVSQAISVDQTLMGTLRLNLAAQQPPSTAIYLLIATLFTAVSGLAVWVLRTHPLKERIKAPEEPTTIPEPSIGPDTSHLNDDNKEKNTQQMQSIAVVHLINNDQLYQQLNAEARQLKWDQLEKSLDKLLPLYSGQRLAECSDTITLGFRCSDHEEGLFQAICCSHLLLKTAEQQKWLLKLSVSLHPTNTEGSLAGNINVLKAIASNDTEGGKLYVGPDITQFNDLTLRVVVSPKGDNLSTIDGFKGAYGKLLSNQLSHLLTLTDNNNDSNTQTVSIP